jgi:Na+-driven multidrug efflux pump
MGSQTCRLLEGRIAPTLLRLAAPNIAVMLAQAAVNTGEAYFVGWAVLGSSERVSHACGLGCSAQPPRC